MAYGFMIESEIAARNVQSFNKDAVGTENIDGGCLVQLTPPEKAEERRWTAAKPDGEHLTGLYIAYNPSLNITDVNGKEITGVSIDKRDYTNIGKKTLTCWKPKVGDTAEFSYETLGTDAASAVKGDILESETGKYQWKRIQKSTGATVGHTAMQIIDIIEKPMPIGKGKIGHDFQKMFLCTVVQE